MHYRYIVVMDKDHADTSEEARTDVRDYLEENDFAGSGRRFNSGLADWFVIGGRWSGELTRVGIGEEKMEAFYSQFDKNFGLWTSGKSGVTDEMRKEQIESEFWKFFPDYSGFRKPLPLVFSRSQYKDNGYEDDAQIIDEALYENLIKDLQEKLDEESYLDIDYKENATKEEMLGRWVVVVDYHN